MTETYAVLVAKPELPARRAVSDFLEEMLRIPEDDAMQLARRAWGFLGENLPLEQAQFYAAKSKERGMEAVVVATSRIAVLPAPKKLKKANLNPEVLSCVAEAGVIIDVPWNAVTLVCAAPVKEERRITQTVTEGPSAGQKAASLAIFMTTGLPIKLGGKKTEKKVEKIETELVFYADIFAGVAPYRLRMSSEDFDFSCLGNLKEYSSRLNFGIFLKEAASRASSAILNRGCSAILAKEQLSLLGYDSFLLFEKECRWLSTLEQIGREKRSDG